MKKIWLIVLISITLGAISCDKDKDDDKTFYTVTFETDGGTPVPSVQRVEAGGTATAPATNPSKTGYIFSYWHLSGNATAYNFQASVNSNITLYAKWQEEATAEYWQVTWSLNGGSWPSGDNHAAQVLKGGVLSEPNAPTRTGYTFDGWYKESALTNKITFPYDVKGITENFILYAKWESEGGEETTDYTIRNTTDWNNAVSAIRAGGANKSYTLTVEGTVSVPPTTGVDQAKPDTYTFGGAEDITVTLKGSGTLALSGKGFLLCMTKKSGDNQKLIIDGPILQGRDDNTVPLLRLESADLELKNGKITGNINNGGGGSGSGGGVYIERGILTMSGGEISNNTCGQKSYVANGGGVNIRRGTFDLSGGEVSGNTGNNGGGVCVDTYSTFNMTGGIIKGNTACSSSPYGGGVYIHAYADNFSKTGGIIYGSDAVDINKNKIVHNAGLILNNRGVAAFYTGAKNWIPDSSNRLRESTSGENDNMSIEGDTGWGL